MCHRRCYFWFSPFLLREVQRHEQILSGGPSPRSFSFPSSPFVHFFSSSSSFRGSSHESFRKCPLTNPLGSVLSRILWVIPSHESFGKSPLTHPLGNLFSRILWETTSHEPFGNLLPLRSRSGFPSFFEPSRASEARRRRQEAREGVPKRTGACERGGEARRRKPWWEVNDHLPNNR